MRKKIIIITLSILGFIILCVGGFAGWFFYQFRDMQPIETAQISDSIFVIKGDISNMYLLKKNDTFVAFDAGDDPKKITKGCQSLSIDPSAVKAVFLTHSDADHVDGLPVFDSAKVYLSSDEVLLLNSKDYRHFLGMGHMNELPVSEYETLSDGDSIMVGGIVIHAIATPGHTIGSMCFRVGESLFTGDLCIIVDEKIHPMLELFTEDIKMDSISIQKIAGMQNINYIYTAHTGYTTDLNKALEMWR
jgi:hydroxyacylglutathione hydrolase